MGSYFKGTKTNFKLQRFLFEGCLVQAFSESLQMVFNRVICFGKVLIDLITS